MVNSWIVVVLVAMTLGGLPVWAAPAHAEGYDLVLAGGRVMDPETGLDGVRDVGITRGRIARISVDPLQGARVLDVRGLVVSPGFIDLHQHAQDDASARLKAFDGVTTALELEIGVPDVATFLGEKAGRSVINYGTSASHAAARAAAFETPLRGPSLVAPSGPSTSNEASEAQLRRIEHRLGTELDAGALAVGMGIQYTPGASRLEVIRMFRLAAHRGVPVYTHVRSFGRHEPGSSIGAVGEVIAAAAVTGAALQIVHINSSCLGDALECLALVAGARARGLDVTTEAYPYVAGMATINSALFDPGWREQLGVDYDAVQLPGTGERLTQARFDALRAANDDVAVLLFSNTQAMVDAVIASPLVMIASDGEDGHPRNAGTFSHVLARYVRERGSLTLMDAIRKMTLMPALRLERSTAAARRKGRLQEGADADVIAFDPATVADRATYQAPRSPAVGMRYVIVDGTVLIDQGEMRPGRFPGRAVVGEAAGHRSP